MNKDIYYNKYLKYKQKYIELKKTGGAFRNLADCDIASGITSAKFNDCLSKNNSGSIPDHYFVVLFLYTNVDGRLSNNLCEILNSILLNTNIKTDNIYLFTQNIENKDDKLKRFVYDNVLNNTTYNDNLIFDSGSFSDCKQLLKLIKDNNINHFMTSKKDKTDIDVKLKSLINELNKQIQPNSVVHLSIHTHGFDTDKDNETLISLDGSNTPNNPYSFNELYALLEPLIINPYIDILNLLPSFCYNSTSFKPQLLNRLSSLTITKIINYFTLQVSVQIIDLLFYYSNFQVDSQILLNEDIDSLIQGIIKDYSLLRNTLYTEEEKKIIEKIIENIIKNTNTYRQDYNDQYITSYKLVPIYPNYYEDVDIVAGVKFFTEYLFDNSIDNLSDKIKEVFKTSKISVFPEYFKQSFDIDTYWNTVVKPNVITRLK